jgi:LPPG:FO 2-phospho-L-lactate transferase
LTGGESLSQITLDFCRAWGIEALILPATNDPVPTRVHTDLGWLPFQEYFVERRCEPQVISFRFEGVEQALPAPGVLAAIKMADLVVICPSNPWVSIDPILSIPGIREAVVSRPVVAVSPIIGGKAVKGPAAKMYAELGIQPSALNVARHYGSLLSGFVFDREDSGQAAAVRQLGIEVLTVDTLMRSQAERLRLANDVLEFGFKPGRHDLPGKV